jgi:DNA-directed RNA polymerase sigma subunit (sigma70/sigma32)
MFEAVQLLKHVERMFCMENPGKGEPTDEDLMKIIDGDKDRYKVLRRTKLYKVRYARRFLTPLYLNDHVHTNDGEGDELLDLVCHDEKQTQDILLEDMDARFVVGNAIMDLDERTRKIILLRQQGLTLDDIGVRIGSHTYKEKEKFYSRERMRQLEKEAIQDIRERLDIRC